MTDQPHFRFYPNAYADEEGAFEASEETCDVCSRKAVWLYTGEIYAEGEPPSVCARCISDGSLRKRLPRDSYTMQDIMLEDAEPDLADEVLYATPSVASLNPFEWPVRNGKPLAFMGAGDSPSLKGNAAARAAIKHAFEEAGDDDGHPSHTLVFKQIDGNFHVAVIDLD
ncbi:MAG: CbrC family protein [Pseudomonadota bacterium]